MKTAIIALLSLVAFPAFAGEVRVYQSDAYGNLQYSKPSYLITDRGKIVQIDKFGNKLYGEQQFQITGDKVVAVDAYGNRQYRKPTLAIERR
jgi:hypothetical protein